METLLRESDGQLKLTINGVLDETSNFSKIIIPDNHKKIDIYCDSVSRINSVGAKQLMRFLQNLKVSGIEEVTLNNCSFPIVETINLLLSFFSEHCFVNSIYIPFQCEQCYFESSFLMTTEEVKKANFMIKSRKCPKCQGLATFSDDPYEFLGFINYIKKDYFYQKRPIVTRLKD